MEVDRRRFSSESEYKNAIKDAEKIDKIRRQYDLKKYEDVDKLYSQMMSGSISFLTSIGDDFDNEIYELRQTLSLKKDIKEKKSSVKKSTAKKSAGYSKKNESHTDESESNHDEIKASKKVSQRLDNSRLYSPDDPEMAEMIKKEIIKLERRRTVLVAIFALLAFTSIGYFIFYYANIDSSEKRMQEIAGLVGSTALSGQDGTATANIVNPDNPDAPPILEQYQTLYNSNKRLIGWLKIDDTNIDYPVMQCDDNEFYLSHNFDSEEDKAGAIFLDCNCDVLKKNDNMIIYGHHLTSGRMFSQLGDYEKQSFFEKHQYIQFDTIYEQRLYQVMFAFRSKVYNEDDVVFKYYQFINANSEEEFNSYMLEMNDKSFYETGVWAFYGDELLTLSTCDYHEDNGRFVVVAKRVK
ncbi:MAG: class B sortase [Lachnospiraceae bacterium]|nr:class B sortase [Lachnospiraceae bacterium]